MSDTKNNLDLLSLDPNSVRVLGDLQRLPMGGELEGCLVDMARYEAAGSTPPLKPYTYTPMGDREREDGEKLGWLRVDGKKVMLTPKGREAAMVSVKLGRCV